MNGNLEKFSQYRLEISLRAAARCVVYRGFVIKIARMRESNVLQQSRVYDSFRYYARYP